MKRFQLLGITKNVSLTILCGENKLLVKIDKLEKYYGWLITKR